MTNYTIIQNIWHDGDGLARNMEHRIFGRDTDLLADGLYIEDYSRHYYSEGRLHRLDGPAISNPETGYNQWVFKGQYIQCESQEEFVKMIKLLVFL